MATKVLGHEPFDEVILPQRVIPQPQPPLNAEGDCGACVLGGVLGLTVEQVYERVGKVQAFSWDGVYHFLWDALGRDEIDRLVWRAPTWPVTECHRGFGNPAWLMADDWFRWIQMAIDGGTYPLLNYAIEGGGPLQSPDHFAMIVGCRQVRTRKVMDSGTKFASIDRELLISCSSTRTPPEEWVEVGDLLRERGGYNCFLVRPTSKPA